MVLSFLNPGEQALFCLMDRVLHCQPLVSRNTVNRIKRERMLKWKPERELGVWAWGKTTGESGNPQDLWRSSALSQSQLLRKLQKQAFWVGPLSPTPRYKKRETQLLNNLHKDIQHSREEPASVIGYQIPPSFKAGSPPLLKNFGDLTFIVWIVLHFSTVKLQET